MVIANQPNILEIFGNFAALMMVMEIDDIAGGFFKQTFDNQLEDSLVIFVTREDASWANSFSVLCATMLTVLGWIFLYLEDQDQNWN